MNQVALARIEAMKENPQPTPPVGEPLVWYQANDRNRPVAAQCQGHEGPGRIKITIHSWQGMPMHRSACYYVDHPNHEKPNDATRNNGSWDYPGGKRPPKADMAIQEQEIERQLLGLMKAEEEAKKNAEMFAKKKAERLAGAKKAMIPEPLPATV